MKNTDSKTSLSPSSGEIAGHTPGPWIETGKTIRSGSLHVADVIYAANEAIGQANARLIAAAPELLKALKVANGILTAMVADSRNDLHHAAVALARAAIAKAEGRTEGEGKGKSGK